MTEAHRSPPQPAPRPAVAAPTSGEIRLGPTWLPLLENEFQAAYLRELKAFLSREKAAAKTIYPQGSEYFAALDLTPFDRVKVVILGQDPYHGPGQAHGLSFSVRPGVPPPPSLVNIYKELTSDLGLPKPSHGYLGHWAEQGVLLLNAVLTVAAGEPASHAGKGWEPFTDRIIALLNERREHLAFVLWGAYAQRKGQFIDRKRHLVIATPHPSPLSAHRGFLGSRPFSRINAYLQETGQTPIDWQV